MIATKGHERIKFYTYKEYDAQKNDLKGYKIQYFKGLGGQSLNDYKAMLGNEKKLEMITKDENADMSIRKWFGKKSAKERKDTLKDEI